MHKWNTIMINLISASTFVEKSKKTFQRVVNIIYTFATSQNNNVIKQYENPNFTFTPLLTIQLLSAL